MRSPYERPGTDDGPLAVSTHPRFYASTARPADEVRADLARAEDALAGELGAAGGGDVRRLLHEFVARLDIGWILEVGCCAMEYLIAEIEGANGPAMCWLN